MKYKSKPWPWIVWNHRLHQITGEIALKQDKASPVEFKRWAQELKEMAKEFLAAAKEIKNG